MSAPVGRGWASGKLILLGEHAVVHGQPALAFAVNRGTTATVAPAEGPTTVAAPFLNARVEAAVHLAVGAQGRHVTLASDLPVGRGMGSSASLAVALVRARRAWPGDAGGTEFDAAMPIEAVFHGNPSGVDVAVACHGGVVRYQRAPTPTITPLACPTWQAVVIDTGKVGVTAELVAGVAARRPAVDGQLAAIGALVDEAQAVLHDAAALGPLLTRCHGLLGEIGVSTPELDAIVAWACEAGALGAKLSGAGGGGVVLAMVTDPAPVLAEARARGYEAWTVRPAEAPT